MPGKRCVLRVPGTRVRFKGAGLLLRISRRGLLTWFAGAGRKNHEKTGVQKTLLKINELQSTPFSRGKTGPFGA